MAIIDCDFKLQIKHHYLILLLVGLVMVIIPLPALGQLIVAHRGASYSAPENTLAAFELAWQEDADAIEGDFRLTRDGHIVCIHDKNTSRTSNVDCEVAASDLSDLQTLDVGSWKHKRYADQRIPTLERVLEIVPAGKKIFIELKAGPEIVAPLQKVVENSPLDREQMVVISFNKATVREVKKRLPEIKAHWLTGYDDDGESESDSYERISQTLRWCQADGLGSEAKRNCFDEGLVRQLEGSGLKEFHVWTVDDPQDAKYYAALGAYGITTNRPAYIRKHLGIPPKKK